MYEVYRIGDGAENNLSRDDLYWNQIEFFINLYL